jgi:protein-tyrosine phosphatase
MALYIARALQSSSDERFWEMLKSILFLCTGNYYRSRFAEELFNHRAREEGLSWIAYSRALAIERGTLNVGPLSPHTTNALEALGVIARGTDRLPQQCTIADLASADCIIALKESEHRPLLVERFPGWESRVEYWHIDDIEDGPPSIAFNAISREIGELLDQLREQRD